MAAERPSFVLAPNWDFPADGAIALGNLIKDPKRPERALEAARVDPAVVVTTRRSDWSFSRSDSRSGHVGLWTSILAPILGVSGNVAASASRGSSATFNCGELETRYFVPSDAFIAGSLSSASVAAYTENHWWRSIYMITGLKIAHGATMATDVKRGHGGGAKIGIDGTPFGASQNIGPGVSYEHEKRQSVRFHASEPFVLAYQLLRIKPKRNNDFKSEIHNSLALFSEGERLGEEERKRVVEEFHEEWEVGELKEPAENEEMETIELISTSEWDCNILFQRHIAQIDEDSAAKNYEQVDTSRG